jgi:hypothetical protein
MLYPLSYGGKVSFSTNLLAVLVTSLRRLTRCKTPGSLGYHENALTILQTSHSRRERE